MDLLFLADEQEEMIEEYLSRGTMYVLEDDGIKGECVVTDEGDGILEIKNIATIPEVHGKGYGRRLIDFVEREYSGRFSILQVGTGDSPLTIPFYEKCGFELTDKVRLIDRGGEFKQLMYARSGSGGATEQQA